MNYEDFNNDDERIDYLQNQIRLYGFPEQTREELESEGIRANIDWVRNNPIEGMSEVDRRINGLPPLSSDPDEEGWSHPVEEGWGHPVEEGWGHPVEEGWGHPVEEGWGRPDRVPVTTAVREDMADGESRSELFSGKSVYPHTAFVKSLKDSAKLSYSPNQFPLNMEKPKSYFEDVPTSGLLYFNYFPPNETRVQYMAALRTDDSDYYDMGYSILTYTVKKNRNGRAKISNVVDYFFNTNDELVSVQLLRRGPLATNPYKIRGIVSPMIDLYTMTEQVTGGRTRRNRKNKTRRRRNKTRRYVT